jgi:hypothetical protein
MPRHSWKELTRNISICIHCGCRRTQQKQSGPWRTSIPDFHYTGSLGHQLYTADFAGDCPRVWPENWEPEWRLVYFKPPQQQDLFK